MGLPLDLAESFDILGVKPGDDPGHIRSAFRRLALTCHPDVAGSKHAARFERIAGAYALLRRATPEEIGELLRKPPQKEEKKPRSHFWRKKTDRKKPPSGETPSDSLRVRELLLEKALVEAEIAVTRLFSSSSRREEEDLSSLRLRLLGSLPGVRLLALASLGKRGEEKEVFAILLEMARRWPSDDETVEGLLLQNLREEQRYALSEILCSNAPLLSERAALELLRRIRRFPGKDDLLQKMLFHPAPSVLSRALGAWSSPSLPDELTLLRLLKRGEEEILVPLLRLLRLRGAPPWAAGRIRSLSSGHPGAAVRVWAGSIVRAENLV
ncbi:MAG: J domain-containing protein [Synergistaceae bacterium]|nr:J domain-containing protein [Synergistaceae bacterium]